ncbi:hypothetical protein ACFPRL_14765 [Pseudoclavibacter helvolus]
MARGRVPRRSSAATRNRVTGVGTRPEPRGAASATSPSRPPWCCHRQPGQ